MLFYHLPRAYAPGESLPHVVGGGSDAGRRSERNVRRVVVVVGESGRDSRGTNCRHRGRRDSFSQEQVALWRGALLLQLVENKQRGEVNFKYN